MKTAYVTDARFAGHTLADHPEHAGRLAAVEERLTADGLRERLLPVDVAPATEDDLLAVHDPGHLKRLSRVAEIGTPTMFGPDTYVLPDSYAIAVLAAGAVLRVVDAVMGRQATNGLAAVRPPGHHATRDEAMGFCLLNNVAIAARYAQRQYGVRRVLIVDYDVHHGNGTQDIFYSDPSVYYISTHQSPLYPGTGDIREIGAGRGERLTLNIPLAPGTGDAGFFDVFDQVVIPAAERFEPALILVSAGFDAHWADPLANLRLTLSGYDRLTRSLYALAGRLCEGRVIFVLEGGYNLQVLSHGWANVARALTGDPAAVDPVGPAREISRPVDALIARLKQLHQLS